MPYIQGPCSASDFLNSLKFQAENDKYNSLDLSFIQDPEIVKTRLSAAKNTKYISLSNSKFNDSALELISCQGESIRTLDLSGTDTKRITINLSNLQFLAELNLSKNRISELPKELVYLENLKKLSIAKCAFESLSFQQFEKLKALTHLDVSFNRIQCLPDNFNLPHLVNLNARGNQLTCIPNSIKHLKCLIKLDLSKNDIVEFEPIIWRNQSIQILNLSENKIKNIRFPEDTHGIKALILKGNLIEEIPLGITKTPQLNILDMRRNNLKTIASDICKSNLSSLILDTFKFFDCPPSKVAEQGLEAIKDYFKMLEAQIHEENGIHVEFTIDDPLSQNANKFEASIEKECSVKIFQGSERIVLQDISYILINENANESQILLPIVNNDTSTVILNLSKTGKYSIHAQLDGKDINGSPCEFFVKPTVIDHSNSKIHVLTPTIKAGDRVDIQLDIKDKLGNLLDATHIDNNDLEIVLVNKSRELRLNGQIFQKNDKVIVSDKVTIIGTYKLHVKYQSFEAISSLEVTAGNCCHVHSFCEIDNDYDTLNHDGLKVYINMRDEYDNVAECSPSNLKIRIIKADGEISYGIVNRQVDLGKYEANVYLTGSGTLKVEVLLKTGNDDFLHVENSPFIVVAKVKSVDNPSLRISKDNVGNGIPTEASFQYKCDNDKFPGIVNDLFDDPQRLSTPPFAAAVVVQLLLHQKKSCALLIFENFLKLVARKIIEKYNTYRNEPTWDLSLQMYSCALYIYGSMLEAAECEVFPSDALSNWLVDFFKVLKSMSDDLVERFAQEKIKNNRKYEYLIPKSSFFTIRKLNFVDLVKSFEGFIKCMKRNFISQNIRDQLITNALRSHKKISTIEIKQNIEEIVSILGTFDINLKSENCFPMVLELSNFNFLAQNSDIAKLAGVPKSMITEFQKSFGKRDTCPNTLPMEIDTDCFIKVDPKDSITLV
ncbi:hypothetical protein O9G_001005 [Rozella allomycis CSF55]|uniref:L domain-like protein n=1 Tax=Rozella allomycis (strain CSF55) TaxID=988480 RepID=A0A075AMY0_ROZAC|nr:hypothetical protein O9G_001005 [Rozella allomycis CSF55]|eukprot:EPZ31094.1 hypothetical protein O9G_001005 [Rozella allomycis CSF55]